MPALGWRKARKIVETPFVFARCDTCFAPTSSRNLRCAGPERFCKTCWLASVKQDRIERREMRREMRLEDERRKVFEASVISVLTEIARRRIAKGKGVIGLAEEHAVRLAKLPERIAAIVGKTYSECGDAFEVEDDTAIGMIRDLLLEIDPELINRNKKKKLARRISH